MTNPQRNATLITDESTKKDGPAPPFLQFTEERKTDMEKTDPRYRHFVQILREELVPAMGCTEPIAIAYAAVRLRRLLGTLPAR